MSQNSEATKTTMHCFYRAAIIFLYNTYKIKTQGKPVRENGLIFLMLYKRYVKT
jgi:hypothetical protein